MISLKAMMINGSVSGSVIANNDYLTGIKMTRDTCGHFKNSFIVIFNPQNMSLDTLFVQLSAILAEIIVKNIFFGNGGTNLHKNDT